MFLTNVLFKKAKSKYVMVLLESVVSGHKFIGIRERLADKLEMIRFDPYTPVLQQIYILEVKCIQRAEGGESKIILLVQQESIYKERKKIRSIKST